jgi:hypothetical protein
MFTVPRIPGPRFPGPRFPGGVCPISVNLTLFLGRFKEKTGKICAQKFAKVANLFLKLTLMGVCPPLSPRYPHSQPTKTTAKGNNMDIIMGIIRGACSRFLFPVSSGFPVDT